MLSLQLYDRLLELEHAYGYSGVLPGARSTTGTNLHFLASGEACFPCSAVVVCHDAKRNAQRFFVGHDDDVCALAIHPGGSIVASGQVGKDPEVYVWDSAQTPPAPLQLLTGVHERAVCCLGFSPDGVLLCSCGEDNNHAVAVHEWRGGALLAKVRGSNAPVYSLRFNPSRFTARRDSAEHFFQIERAACAQLRPWMLIPAQCSAVPFDRTDWTRSATRTRSTRSCSAGSRWSSFGRSPSASARRRPPR